MKRLLLICLILIACDKDEGDDKDGYGCLTGIHKTSKQRILIRCCTYKEYTAGSNVSAGGTSNFDNYTGHSWVATDDCGSCR